MTTHNTHPRSPEFYRRLARRRSGAATPEFYIALALAFAAGFIFASLFMGGAL